MSPCCCWRRGPRACGPSVASGIASRRVGRIVAIEMPGFGHSDQSRPELIAPDAAGAFLARLIDEWGLGSPHVVGPDVGTAAALFLAARAPERVTSLTVGGGAVRFPIDAAAPSRTSSRRRAWTSCARSMREPTSATRSRPAPRATGARSPRGLRQRLRPRTFRRVGRFVRHYPEQNPVLRELLPTITTPTQIVAGRTTTSFRGRTTSTSTSFAQQRDSPPRRRSLRLGAGSGRIRPPRRRLGQRWISASRSGLAAVTTARVRRRRFERACAAMLLSRPNP